MAKAKKRAGDSVAAGREYVAAYVDSVHYAERVVQAAARPAGAPGTRPVRRRTLTEDLHG